MTSSALLRSRGAVLLAPEQRWECPNCTLTEVTRHQLAPGQAATRFHPCRGNRGVLAPMVAAGTKCKVEVLDREDYVGKEIVRTDGEGRPVMSVRTTRDDGYDTAVFAPLAVAVREDH